MSENRLGPFELQGIIGRGGMGTVYRGKHVETGEVVAVKALSPTYSNDDHFRSRFESEIEALLNLDHPNIVRLLSYGQEDGNLFFAMELVEGKSLFHIQKSGGTFDWRDALVVARDVAKGLRHAHDRGIIHRDLKPGNLLKSDEGIIKITDFGIAKKFGNDHNTRDNVLGTLDFMSPEQAKGQPVTVRSDLFSLGIVLYTILNGRPPFSANSMEESLRNLTSVPAPRLSAQVPNLPIQIEELISALIEKRPEDRIQTAQALLHKISETELLLKHYSEAKTAHGQQPAPRVNPAQVTRELSGQTIADESDIEGLFIPEKKVTKSSKVSATPTVEIHSRAEVANDTEIEEVKEKPDYFKTVTDEERAKTTGDVSEEEAQATWGSILPLAGALVAVIVVAIVGSYMAFLPPSADSLFETISQRANQPDKVHEEIKKFIEIYPEDERISEIIQLDEIAKGIDYYKKLSARSGISGETRLTRMEREFVKIADAAQDDFIDGYTRLFSFIQLHEPDADNEDKAECLTHAKNYLKKLRNDAANDYDWHRDAINDAFKRAENSTLPEQRQIYQSIIEVYKDSTWATQFIDNAKEKLKMLDP